jgi:hypothetical protein
MLTDDEFNLVQEQVAKRSRARYKSHNFPLTGLIQCKCGYQLTAETRTKPSGKQYSYYKCSQSSNGCKQPRISAPKLEEQVVDFLGQLKLKKSFVKFATKWVRKMEGQDREVRNRECYSIKTEHDRISKTLDNLTDKWLSPVNEDKTLLTDIEYRTLKQKYLVGKDKLANKLKMQNKDQGEWTDFMVDIFNFSSNAQTLWRIGDISTKRTVMSIIGANIIHDDRKLAITPDTLFSKVRSLGSDSQVVPDSGVDSKILSLMGE